MCLATWLLQGSYIYEGNKTLNMIFFVSMRAIHFLSLHILSITNSCAVHYTELHNYLHNVAYLVSVIKPPVKIDFHWRSM
jgi:hypothetical protein